MFLSMRRRRQSYRGIGRESPIISRSDAGDGHNVRHENGSVYSRPLSTPTSLSLIPFLLQISLSRIWILKFVHRDFIFRMCL